MCHSNALTGGNTKCGFETQDMSMSRVRPENSFFLLQNVQFCAKGFLFEDSGRSERVLCSLHGRLLLLSPLRGFLDEGVLGTEHLGQHLKAPWSAPWLVSSTW